MCTQIRAIDAVIPKELITNEKTATFVVNLMKETIDHVENKNPQGLDAFPGDRLCQGRLMILPELLEDKEVCQEAKQLSEAIKANNQDGSSLEISRDFHFLMDCRLLKITRSIKSIEPNGTVLSKMDYRQLSTLSSTLSGKIFDKITQCACTRLSKETMVRLQEYGKKMQVSALHQRMLHQVVVFTVPNYQPKTFGCQFFTVHLALHRLLEQKTPIVIKTIVREGLSLNLFFKAARDNFESQEQLEKTPYVAIFQAVVPSEEALLGKIKKIGFIELILRYAAQETPFEHTSSHEDVNDPEARGVLEDYRRKAKESGCDEKLMRIHHLYSSSEDPSL